MSSNVIYNPIEQIASLTSSLGTNLTYSVNSSTLQPSKRVKNTMPISPPITSTTAWYLSWIVCSQEISHRALPMMLVNSKTHQSSKTCRERKYHWGKADRLLKPKGTTTYEYSITGHLQKATYADGREEYRLSDKVGNLFNTPMPTPQIHKKK